jgi:two-component sensor histidine kinase
MAPTPLERAASATLGTRLIQRVVAYELDGRAELDHAPDGLSCEIVLPMD